MRFKLYTLVDITETGARKGDNPKAVRQQQNFLSVIQTIGLRVNPTYIKPPKVIKEIPKNLGLGSSYTKKQNVWEFMFDIEYEDALDIDTLKNDFNLIPIISNLDESVIFKTAAFSTKDDTICNIFFEELDK